METSGRLRIGISACLVGAPVRYDGRDKRAVWPSDEFLACFDCVSVCPEVECGFPVPREPLRLEGSFEAPRLIGIESRQDWTARLLAWSRRQCDFFAKKSLCGFIFKARSPSCGLAGVELFAANGTVRGSVSGLFAGLFCSRFPSIPVVEAESLCARAVRRDFLARVRAYAVATGAENPHRSEQ